MREARTGRAIINESRYPHLVEVAVNTDKLGVELSRRILDFHRSRNIQVKHGRSITKEGKFYFRWCFSDLATALAFLGRFGGQLVTSQT